ncbi:substrate-binding periplasmic protein [Niveispirillum fermenti]|uniref:substrate-binding periplasmic protein n=1 Tax=Niveispirillum fermenti TaxID=1233113 RepID=UPI003A874013
MRVMKLRIRVLPAALAVLLVLPVLSAGAGASAVPGCHLRFALADLPPFQSLKDGRPAGIDVELVAEVARRMDCRVEWEQAPRQRAMVLLQEGKVDAVAGVARTAEREAIGLYSAPLRHGRNVLVVRRGEAARFPLASLRDLAGTSFRLGIVQGSRYSQEFEDLVNDGALAGNLVAVQNGESAMAMLMRDRIDGFLDGYRVAMDRAGRLDLVDKVEAHPMPVSGPEAYVVFSVAAKLDPSIPARFDAALAAMRADGTVARIVGTGDS